MAKETADTQAPLPVNPVPADWRQLHLWHIQPVRDLLVLAVVVGLIYLGYTLRSVTVPMLLALLLAYLFEPLVEWLSKFRRINRPMAVGGILAAFVLIVVIPTLLGAGFAVVQAIGLAGTVVRNSSALVTSIKDEDEAARTKALHSLPRGWQYMSQRINTLRLEVEQHRKQRGEAEPDKNDPQKDIDKTDTDPQDSEKQTKPDSPGEAPATSVVTRSDAPADAPRGAPQGTVGDIAEWKSSAYDIVERGVDWVSSNAADVGKTVGRQAFSGGIEAVSMAVVAILSVAGLGFTIFLTGFFFFFMSTGFGRVRKLTKEFIPKNKRYETLELLYQMDAVIAGFVRGRLTICAILGLVMMFLYWLIGVPMPLLMGAVVGALFIVPFIHVLAVPVAILLLWLGPGSGPLGELVGGISARGQATWWWIIFAPVGVYLIAQFLDDWVLSVTISAKATNMDTPTILFASLAGGVLAGLYGVLLAIPVAACLKIILREVVWPRFKQWAAGKATDFLPISPAPPETVPAAPPPPLASAPTVTKKDRKGK
ncbi:MAG: AI-2E family transporter [Pyrinomonadaceae bacterium]|nr:AI-2E family transporter [Phycisphaerales bacterium]